MPFPKEEKETKRARTALAALKEGQQEKKKPKYYETTEFPRPKTLETPSKPLFPRKSFTKLPYLDKYRIIISPLNTEAAMKSIEDNNCLIFLVDRKSTKPLIKQAVKDLYNVDVKKVNTLIRPDGQKKAFVTLGKESDALDVANRIGII